jgi:L-aspartate oxidase
VHPTTASAHGDTVTSHIEDTLATGSGLCDPEAVSLVIHGAQEAIQWLIDLGVPFAKAQGPHAPYHLVQEGGHTHRRIFHVDDATGHAIASTLALHAQKHPNIHILEEYTAIDLLIKEQTCSGLYALHAPSKSVKTLLARSTVLATGGASKAYLYTSNPDSSSGDGIAMAYRAGCEIRDLEFHQFHPTCLYHPHAKSFLISEALRGEGGQLLLPDGSRFMDNFDERGELAPRDIVARAIDHELKRLGIDCVYLDISHRDAASIRAHFPNIATRCLQYFMPSAKLHTPVYTGPIVSPAILYLNALSLRSKPVHPSKNT